MDNVNLKNILFLVFFYTLLISCTNNQSRDHESRPNIIFIMSDDHAYQAISAYDSSLVQTPNIDKIANEGILYQKAFVTNSICAPSRAVILTGKFSHLNGVIDNSSYFDGSQQTVSKILRQNGYQTAIVGKWHLKSAPTGFNYWNILPGQGDYYNPDFIKMGKDTVYSGYVTDIITKLSIRFLNTRDKNKPFFLMMHHKAPHRNWMPAIRHLKERDEDYRLPENFFDNYSGREPIKKGMALRIDDHMHLNMDFKLPIETNEVYDNNWFHEETERSLGRLTGEERLAWNNRYTPQLEKYESVKNNKEELILWKYSRYLNDYLNCIKAVDESVGQINTWLKENGLEENTVVIYTSDQGFFLGEHGFFDKRIMYEEAFRTPLLIKYPRKIKNLSTSEHLVQNLDIAPTLLDLADIAIPEDMQGKSLYNTWSSSLENWREAIYYRYYEKDFLVSPHYGIRTDRYKLIHFNYGIDSWELYDLVTDPNEMNNLYADPKYEKKVKYLKNKLIELQHSYRDTSAIVWKN